MRFRCIKNKDTHTEGLIFKKEVSNTHRGIQVGSAYTGIPVPSVEGSIVSGYGDIETEVKLLTYNDNQKWELYPIDFFIWEE